jgi:hypothetical protein
MKLKLILLTAAATLSLVNEIMAQVPNYVPTNGLVGWWPFSGNANDQSINGYNGTVAGAALDTDRFGNANMAYTFDGVNDSIKLNLQQTNITAYSISGWFKTSVGGPILAGRGLSNQTGLTLHILNIPTGGSGQAGKAMFVADGSPVSIGKTTVAAYNDNQWHHIVGVYSGNIGAISPSQFQIYVDNILISQTTNNTAYSATAPISNGTNLLIGAHQVWPTGGIFNGKLDDIGIWNRALTQQEITNLYSSPNNTCNLITSVTLNAQQTQSLVTNTAVGYLPNAINVVADTTQWHYIALTKSGSTGNFYFDGTLIVNSSFANNPYIWNSLLLGASQGCVSCSPGPDFKGLIDEVRVSNIARTSSSISNYYSSNSPFTQDANTIGLFHLDNVSGSTISNSIGGTAATFGTPSLTNGKFGQALNFDGIDDYVRWSNSIPVNSMTVEFWFKSSDQSATMAMLEYAYNTGIYLQSSSVTNPIQWSTGETTTSITVNPSQLPYVWVSNGSCSDTIFFNSQSVTQYDTVTTNVFDTTFVTQTVYDTVQVTIYDTLLTTVTDTLVINAIITGINPPNNLNTLKVFPNPANTHITIDYGNFSAMSGYTLKIVNAVGQTVFTTPINQQSSYIDLSTWSGIGIYFVQLIDPQNNTIENRKILIQ